MNSNLYDTQRPSPPPPNIEQDAKTSNRDSNN